MRKGYLKKQFSTDINNYKNTYKKQMFTKLLLAAAAAASLVSGLTLSNEAVVSAGFHDTYPSMPFERGPGSYYPTREEFGWLAHVANDAGAYEWAAVYLRELRGKTYNQDEREEFARAYLGAASEIKGKLAVLDANSGSAEAQALIEGMGYNLFRIMLERDFERAITSGLYYADS